MKKYKRKYALMKQKNQELLEKLTNYQDLNLELQLKCRDLEKNPKILDPKEPPRSVSKNGSIFFPDYGLSMDVEVKNKLEKIRSGVAKDSEFVNFYLKNMFRDDELYGRSVTGKISKLGTKKEAIDETRRRFLKGMNRDVKQLLRFPCIQWETELETRSVSHCIQGKRKSCLTSLGMKILIRGLT